MTQFQCSARDLKSRFWVFEEGEEIMRKQQSRTVSKLMCAIAPAASLALAVLSFSAPAARGNLYWDTNGSNHGATNGTAADGTWGVDNFWSSDPTGNSATGAWNPFDTAIFSAGTNALTANVAVSGTQNFGGLQFLTGVTTLGGSGTLDYNEDGSENPSVVVPSGQSATINTVINGDGLITLSGGGTLNLGSTQSQANTFGSFSGIVGDNFVSTGALDITGGSKLVFAGENDATADAPNPLGASPESAISNYITLDNGILSNTNSDSSGTSSFVLPDRGIIVTSNGGTLDLPAVGTKLLIAGGSSIQVAGTLTKTGPGTLMMRSNMTVTGAPVLDIEGGTIEYDNYLRFGASTATFSYFRLNGGTLLDSNPGSAGSFLAATSSVHIGPNGGTLNYTSSSTGTVALYGSSTSTNAMILGDGGTTTNGGAQTLTVSGADELRFEGPGMGNNTFAKMVVTGGGLLRAGYDGVVADELESTFGATPLAFLPDAITLNNGFLGSSWGTSLSKNRGITLAAGGGGLINSGGSMTVTGTITGPGAFIVYGNTSTSTAAAVLATDIADVANNWTGGTVLGAPINALFTTATYGNINVSAGSFLGQGPVTFLDGKLTLSNPAQTVASLNSASGVGTVALGSTTVLTLNAATSSASFGGTIIQSAGTGASLIKNGNGTQILTGINTYGGGTTINAGALATPAVADLGSGHVTINGGALLVTDSSQLASVGSLLTASYDGDKWDTGTFRSTTITSNTRNIGYGLVGGQVKVMYTLPGDATLDGKVDGSDLAVISSSGTTWTTGDFNYDGVVNADDLSLFELGAAIGSLPAAPVPEPASCMLTIMSAAGVLSSRRRRSR
jgi:autotransporter-associated beta strand protein